jgi:hypothetical protein
VSIAYPLAMPASPLMKDIVLSANHVVAQSVSPFTAQEQIYQHPGSWWELTANFNSMTRANAELWIAFLLSLRGRFGTFLFGDPSAVNPQGSAGGSPIVSGAGQTGFSLVTTGLTGTIKAGDYFSIGSGVTQRLYKNLTDQTGNSTWDIFPAVRDAPPNNAVITLVAAKGVFRLMDNAQPWSVDSAFIYGLSFKAREAY